MLRLFSWLLFATALTFGIYHVAPQQLPVSLYKISLVAIGGVLGYWLDRSLFPYARPDALYAAKTPDHAWTSALFNAASVRRAVIVAATILALALGA